MSGAQERQRTEQRTNSMFACKAVATGTSGVVVSFDSRSFNELADSVREAFERRRRDMEARRWRSGAETR
jgi:hypothetical protein